MLGFSLTFESLGATSQREEIPKLRNTVITIDGIDGAASGGEVRRIRRAVLQWHCLCGEWRGSTVREALEGWDRGGRDAARGWDVGDVPVRNQKLHLVSVIERHKITYHLVDFL